MKPLKQQFDGTGEVKGYKFTLLNKTDKAFLYKVNTGGDQIHYECFKRRLNMRYVCESSPTSKAFGIWAWSILDLERAIRKFNELNN